jgi:hypothetical protein
MKDLGGEVVRRRVIDVEAELSVAAEAQRAAEREARRSLRAEHRQHSLEVRAARSSGCRKMGVDELYRPRPFADGGGTALG